MNQIGEGTYGYDLSLTMFQQVYCADARAINYRKVFKAQFKGSGKQVALKKVGLKEEEKGKDKHRDGVY
jgi:hypothetical protein